jgi:hypothetical protein
LDCQVLSSLHFLLDFIFKLSHVKHKLINFWSPHCEFFSLQIFSENAFLTCNSFFTPLMGNFLPIFKKSQKLFSVKRISVIVSNSFFFFPCLSVNHKMFPHYSIIKLFYSHFKKSLHAAIILIF